MEGSMLGTCLRRLVVLLSLVAVAAFAGHGSAMAASASFGIADHHSAVPADAVAHADGHSEHGGPDASKASTDAMACCGKSCTSLLPFPLPPEVVVRSSASVLDAVVPGERTGIRPPGLKRPPKLA
jgi:hypothetical protein